MTGIYGSAPGCLCTFPNSPACPGIEGKGEKLGQIATTIARSDRGYAGTYNYFDPDNFFSMPVKPQRTPFATAVITVEMLRGK